MGSVRILMDVMLLRPYDDDDDDALGVDVDLWRERMVVSRGPRRFRCFESRLSFSPFSIKTVIVFVLEFDFVELLSGKIQK